MLIYQSYKTKEKALYYYIVKQSATVHTCNFFISPHVGLARLLLLTAIFPRRCRLSFFTCIHSKCFAYINTTASVAELDIINRPRYPMVTVTKIHCCYSLSRTRNPWSGSFRCPSSDLYDLSATNREIVRIMGRYLEQELYSPAQNQSP